MKTWLFVELEAILTRQLLGVKGWLFGEDEATFQYSILLYYWLGHC